MNVCCVTIQIQIQIQLRTCYVFIYTGLLATASTSVIRYLGHFNVAVTSFWPVQTDGEKMYIQLSLFSRRQNNKIDSRIQSD